tara:strand:+ start:279 stop:479 length:201 start_codon:yes stop_codon:yes gene_type:complete
MNLQELVKISNGLTLEDLATLLELNRSRLIIFNSFEDGRTSELCDVEFVAINGISVRIEVAPLPKG